MISKWTLHKRGATHNPSILDCECIPKQRSSLIKCFSLSFLVLGYNIFGGYLFLSFKVNKASYTDVSISKQNISRSSAELQLQTVQKLWSITEKLNILYRENWTKLADEELMNFQILLLKSLRKNELDYKWSLAESFLYSLSLITRIGYSSISPMSYVGKVTAMLYSCVGIPLVFLHMSIFGEALARSFRLFYSKICRECFQRRDIHTSSECDRNIVGNKKKLEELPKRTPSQAALNLENFKGGLHSRICRDHTRVPIIISLLLIVMYIALGAIIFHGTEKWTLLDGCYFSFLSLSTIGFGNLKPGLYASTISTNSENIAIGICCLYIHVGLVFIAMCFYLIHEEFAIIVRSWSMLCGGSSKARALQSNDSYGEQFDMSIISTHREMTESPVSTYGRRSQFSEVSYELDDYELNRLRQRTSSIYGDKIFHIDTPVHQSSPCDLRDNFRHTGVSNFCIEADLSERPRDKKITFTDMT